jgi:YcaO-like protein with predicted kinase domain
MLPPSGLVEIFQPDGLHATALSGTRIEEPAVTKARLLPRLSDFGITRVANVTGLDRIGIPVYMAIRPNSRSLSVSQGKGRSLDAAWVSGVMETIELWHAESPALSLSLASYDELAKRVRVVDVARLPMRRGSPFHNGFRMLWTEGTDLFSGEPIHVPFGLVHVNAVPPFPPGDECFFVSSNGLASGSVPSEALVHALCEVIERDAVTRWRNLTVEGMAAPWVDLNSVDDSTVRELLARCERADIDVLACDATSMVGIPVFVCVLFDRQESSETLRGAAMGFGCHLRRDIALLRALTEAAQSRLTLIAGSRDDLDRHDYESRRSHRDGIEAYRTHLALPHAVDFASLPDYRNTALSEQLTILFQRLKMAGVQEAAVVDLSHSAKDLAVVRVIVPGLLGPDHAH